jgi:hypothetical protein
MHYEGLAGFTLHRVDERTGQRLDAVREGRKIGFCVADLGLVELGLPGTTPRRYFGEGCVAPDGSGDFWMGISPGWLDVYWWRLPDQYLEVTDLPDGLYVLSATANPDGGLAEATMANNAGETVFRLTGDRVHIL